MSWGQFALFLHILLAIIAFGPTFVFPLIGSAGEKEPQHGNFALRVSEIIEERLVIPAAVALPLVGTWLIYVRNWDLWASEWLWISIAIYIVAFLYAVTLQRGALKKLIEFTKNPPPQPAEGEAPPEPPAEMQTYMKRLQVGGMLLSLAVVTILLLMVWKPGAAFTAP